MSPMQEVYVSISETIPNFDGTSFIFGIILVMGFNFEFVLLYHFVPWVLRSFWEGLILIVKYIVKHFLRKKQDP